MNMGDIVVTGVIVIVGVVLMLAIFRINPREDDEFEDVTDRRLYKFNGADSRGLEEDVVVYTCTNCSRNRMLHACHSKWHLVSVCICRRDRNEEKLA